MVSVVGIPIYLHYCGGELEEVSYLHKSGGCCGDEESDEATSDSGCCKDENLVLKNTTDFTLKKLNNYDFVKTCSELSYNSLPFFNFSDQLPETPAACIFKSPPPGLQNKLIIATMVIRV
jgi:hypothetical protein